MAFTLYPDPPVRALSVRPGETVFTAFAARSARVPEQDPPYAQVMFVRVAMLGGTSAPGLLVAAGAGAPVEVTMNPQAVFRSPGELGHVGDVWRESPGRNVFDVWVGLVAPVDPALGWRLGIGNTDAVERHFTWVVADTEADTAQPWVDPGPLDYQVSAVTVGPCPRTIAVDPDTGRAYVTIYHPDDRGNADGALAVIDPDTPPRTPVVLAGKNPVDVAVDPASHDIYVTDARSKAVVVLDAATLTEKTSIPLNGVDAPLWLAFDESAQRIYVADNSNREDSPDDAVSVIDIATMAHIDTIDVSGRGGLAYDAAAQLLYASGFSRAALGAVTVIDTRNRQIVDVIVLDGTGVDVLRNLVFDPPTNSVYVADDGGIVRRIDAASRTVRDSISVGQRPSGMAVDHAAHSVYVGSFEDATLSVIDTRLHTVRDVVHVPNSPFGGVAVDRRTHTVYAASMIGRTADGSLEGSTTLLVIRPRR